MASETNDPAAKARRVLDGYTALETPLDTAVVYALAPHVWAVVPAVKRGDGDGELFVYCRSQVDAQRLAAALSEYERLRHVEAENEALREIAREIAQAVADGRLRGGSREEVWCCALPYDEALGRFVHTADCPERKARALLADTPPTRSDATQWNNDERYDSASFPTANTH